MRIVGWAKRSVPTVLKLMGTAQARLCPSYALTSPQHSIECRQSDDHRRRDQGVADGAEQRLAGAAEQLSADQDADGIDRADQQRKPDGVGCDEPGQRIA